MPTDTLELGRLIVKELDLDPGVDTLGRWMAHHVAELIGAAEAAPNARLRQECRKDAFEAISRLWSHRSAFENRINPLFELKPIIQIMGILDPDENEYLSRNESTRYVYGAFRRLMICLLFRKVGSLDQVTDAVSLAKASLQFQSDDERTVISTLDSWLDDALTREAAVRSRPLKAVKMEKVDLDEAARKLIAEARKALDEVEQEIARARPKGASSRKSVEF